MPIRFWRALSVAALIVLIAGASRTDALAPDGEGTWTEPLQHTSLQLPGVDPGTKVVAAALADIDADGDLDLIASDGTLDLLVWSNDGTGHFTRKYAVRTPVDGSFARDGALDPGTGTLPAAAVPSGGTFLTSADRVTAGLAVRGWRTAVTASFLRSRAHLAVGSRAPPLTLLVT